MNENQYLKKIFQTYYREKKGDIPIVSNYIQREFGFLLWEKNIMIRHIGYDSPENLKRNLIINAPRHLYSSGALYLLPDVQNMDGKKFQGCDLIFDIDVDHFYTPCKETHDMWQCKDCGQTGKGMLKKCPKCRGLKIKKINWICSKCLNIAKNEIKKILDNFLIPDFAIPEEKIKIAFSGHRGYHLKVESDVIRKLSGNNRREIADYISGMNLSFDILGLSQKGRNIYGLSKKTIGWANKIMMRLTELLKLPSNQLQKILLNKSKYGLNSFQITSLINYKDDFLEILTREYAWDIEGFSIDTWKRFLKGITQDIGAEIDVPVTIDIHRLIRYPGSLHGKTGFKVQELELNELDDFNPLDESNEKLDPIVFKSKKNMPHELEIVENELPITTIKGESFGPYKKGDKIEVPHHFAVFLLCKEVAKMI